METTTAAAPTATSDTDVRRLLAAYTEAKNSHDVDAVVALCADECRFAILGLPERVEGRDALRATFDSMFRAMPDYRATIEGQAVSGQTAVAWGRFGGTVVRRADGAEVAGATVDIPAAFVCTFRDGLLTSESSYFDTAAFYAQAGIAPPGADDERGADGLDHRGRFWIERFREAWAARDLDSLLAPLKPDCFVFYPPMPEPVDRTGLRAFFDYAYSLIPDFKIEPVHWAQTGDNILIEWLGSGTVKGEPYEWGGSDRFRFDAEGRIVEARAYWDPRTLLDRLGVTFGAAEDQSAAA